MEKGFKKTKKQQNIGQLVWSWPVVGAVVVFLGGGGIKIMNPSSPLIADLFFIVGATLFLSKFLTWDISRKHKRRNLVWTIAILATVSIVGIAICGNHYFNSPAKPTLLPTQIELFKELDDLFGTREEVGLREMFDFPLMVGKNIEIIREQLKTGKPYWVRPPVDIMIDTEIAGGDLKHHAGGVHLQLHENKVAMIFLPPKYTQNKKLLLRYENSSVLPTTVVSAVKEFDVTMEENAKLLIRVLNDALQENREYYLQCDDFNSPYWHVIDNMYWRKFKEFRPKADKIRDAIRQSLNTK